MQSLDEFLAEQMAEQKFPNNDWVTCDGFHNLYVRYGDIICARHGRVRCLQLANIQADKPGDGAFTRLVEKFHPQVNIYVENVMFPRFAKKLEAMGFEKLGMNLPPCYLLLKKEGG